MNKAYAAFLRSEEEVSGLTPTAALAMRRGAEGDPYLVLVIQLMAATLSGRDIMLFAFGDAELKEDVYREGLENPRLSYKRCRFHYPAFSIITGCTNI